MSRPETVSPLNPLGDDRMVEAIKAVEAILPGYAVVLVVAPFGAARGRRSNYVSNGERSDIRALLKELLARWECRYQQAGARPQ